MSKVAAYLQEHISGEVSVNPHVLHAMSCDGGIFQSAPEIVIYPRTTNDIRKIARFSWQLAERGHTLPITARGHGTDQTGAAVGNGIILSLPAHMDQIFEYEPKRRLVRVQPGASVKALSDAVSLYGAGIPALPALGTVAGAIANNASSYLSGTYGTMTEWVEQLEVVLANGEVIQTGRISKRELNRKKGLGTLEGEIYRSLDNLIEDNRELIERLKVRNGRTNAGYVAITAVKRNDGSFDLTPLFAGSQGTLGIISEVILRGAGMSGQYGVVLAAFEDKLAARDAIPAIASLNPAFIDSFDGGLFEAAAKTGRHHALVKEAGSKIGTVLLIGFDDTSERGREKRLKKVGKILSESGAWVSSANGEDAGELLTVRDVTTWAALPDEPGMSAPPLLHGLYVPPEQYDVFAAGVAELATKHRVAMPLFGRELSGLYYAWPVFNLKRTGDKQKMYKISDEIARLVEKTGGEMIGEAAEGRVKSRFALSRFDDETADLFKAVKTIFDPYDILNRGVKQPTPIKELASGTRDSYIPPGLPDRLPGM